MGELRLVTSPGESYVTEMVAALEGAKRFVLVTGFATSSGVAILEPSMRRVFERGGDGRIVIAVDRQGFNTAAMFEALLAIKSRAGSRLSIGVVLEAAGLMHAKALYTQGARGKTLLIGSANVTRDALGTNHELGILVAGPPADMERRFQHFVTSLAPRSLDGEDARAFLEERGLLARAPRTPRAPSSPTNGGSPVSPLQEILARLPVQAPLDISPEEHVAGWIARGYLVGRGRRGLDALVLRVPHETLTKQGYLRPPRKESLGLSSHETRTMGYGVDLLPTAQADALRRDARRVSLLLAKVTLTLPCFGLWMPETYWQPFLDGRENLLRGFALDPEHLHEAATVHREYLGSGGLEREVDEILVRLRKHEIVVPDKVDALRAVLLERFARELNLRTPDVVVSCVAFRTSRQRWNPYEQTEAPFRQLMVDVVQASFAATFRTGDWPRRFRSFVGRTVAERVEERLLRAGQQPDGVLATDLLDRASTWEAVERPLADVVAEFRSIVDDRIEFAPPTLDQLVAGATSDAGPTDEEGDDELR